MVEARDLITCICILDLLPVFHELYLVRLCLVKIKSYLAYSILKNMLNSILFSKITCLYIISYFIDSKIKKDRFNIYL